MPVPSSHVNIGCEAPIQNRGARIDNLQQHDRCQRFRGLLHDGTRQCNRCHCARQRKRRYDDGLPFTRQTHGSVQHRVVVFERR